MGNRGFTGNKTKARKNYPTVVTSSLAGTYYLFVSNYGGELLRNIEGIVEITVSVD